MESEQKGLGCVVKHSVDLVRAGRDAHGNVWGRDLKGKMERSENKDTFGQRAKADLETVESMLQDNTQ